MMASAAPLIVANGLQVAYAVHLRTGSVVALDGVSFRIEPGEFVAIIGRSGAGKSTLLRCLTGFVRPTAGQLLVAGQAVTQASRHRLRRLRRETAMIAQHFGLVERLTALDNVLVGRLGHVRTLPSLLNWFSTADRELAYATLGEFGLAERALTRVDRLSGGERQRVAIARALVQRPRIMLADEPAASLDITLTRLVLETLGRLNRERGLTVVASLHDLSLARTYAARILALRHGRLMFDGSCDTLTDSVQRAIYHADEQGEANDAAEDSACHPSARATS
jgi:phosphonate transport system ATP-binding protein